MEVGLLLLLLFRIALAQNCSMGEIDVPEGQTRPIQFGRYINVFVRPGSGFKGITLLVGGQDGTPYTAWFPAEEECFPLGDVWWQLIMWENPGHVTGSIDVVYWIGLCGRKCTINDTTLKPNNYIAMRAHGASKWILGTPPHQCTFKFVNTGAELKQISCDISL